ncbi:MAG: hypothetical protein E7379_02770 [Clostridiales bacterium]|nr:hypothetical protein [Clostridiales bacterium]
MAELKELDIQLADEGWNIYGGKSFNIWGLVDFPPELLKYILDYKGKTFVSFDPNTGKKIKKTGQRAPVWTAFDKYLYNDYNPKSKDNSLPKISATFKSCFDHKYSAIVENMGMHIAIALDMPTSYNYIVAFNPEKHKKIVQNYPTPDLKDKLQPIGIVSIDFLQARQTDKVTTDKSAYFHGKEENPDSTFFFDGDQLITFEDALKKHHIVLDKLAGEENYIEHWIDVVDKIAREEFKNIPKEKLSKITEDIHSRIARSFLLKDCILGDCDFTSYNGGIVVNSHKIRYAANHDYGDICNGLVKNKFTFDLYCGMSLDTFQKLPQAIQDKILAAQKRFSAKTVEQLAEDWASSSSEHNFYYVLKNFPNACKEFFNNTANLIQKKQIEKIVAKYTKITVNGNALLTKEEADMFITYLNARASHYCELYVNHLNGIHSKVPENTELDSYAME